MDTNLALLSTGTGGTIIGILIMVYKAINHKRCRSNCCGAKGELSIDIDNTTPQGQMTKTSPVFVPPALNHNQPESV